MFYTLMEDYFNKADPMIATCLIGEDQNYRFSLNNSVV
jgi:hypothetical protein